MKFLKLLSSVLFLVIFFLFLTSCTQPLVSVTPEPEMNDDRVGHFYTEYEGIASMSTDSSGVFISASDQPERDEYIELRWSYGEHIYFVSEKFEFDVPDCTIWGADSCAKLAYNVKEEYEERDGKNWIYFEPADAFWRCMETENCDPGDEVFLFHLMAREIN